MMMESRLFERMYVRMGMFLERGLIGLCTLEEEEAVILLVDF